MLSRLVSGSFSMLSLVFANINAMHSVAHLALGFYMLWSNIKVSDSTKPSYSPLHADLLQRDRKQGQVTSYEDQLKGEGM